MHSQMIWVSLLYITPILEQRKTKRNNKMWLMHAIWFGLNSTIQLIKCKYEYLVSFLPMRLLVVAIIILIVFIERRRKGHTGWIGWRRNSCLCGETKCMVCIWRCRCRSGNWQHGRWHWRVMCDGDRLAIRRLFLLLGLAVIGDALDLHSFRLVSTVLEPYLDLRRRQIKGFGQWFTLWSRQISLWPEATFQFQYLRLRKQNAWFALASKFAIFAKLAARRCHLLVLWFLKKNKKQWVFDWTRIKIAWTYS